MEFERLPEGPPCQLIDGELVMTPSATFDHQAIVLRIASRILAFVSANQLGHVTMAPMDVYLTDTDVYQPDIIFISKDREDIIHDRIKGAPDLVVEVLSPSNARYDLVHKKKVYEQSGIREYWIVFPEEQKVEVLVKRDNRFAHGDSATRPGIVQSLILPGFTVNLDELFKESPSGGKP